MVKSSKGSKLRDKAAEILSEHIKSEQPLFDKFSELVHELQTYQIELEMQNEELQQSWKELEEAKLKYFDLFEFAPVGYYSLNEKEIITDVNLTGADILGFEKSELINSAFIRYMNFKSRRIFYKHLQKIKKTGKGESCELKLIKKDGTKLHAHLETLPILKDELNFRITVTNITELINAEEALRESEGKYHSLFKSNHASMLLIKPSTGEIVDANPAAASFYGYNLEELVEMNITDINVRSDEEVFREMLKAKSGENNHFLFKHRLADGEIRDVDVYSGNIIINGENLLYSIIHDITKHMEAEYALRESEELFRLIFDQSPIGDVIVDLNYKTLRVNSTFSKMLGYSKEELLSMKFTEYTYPEDLDINLHYLQLLHDGEIDGFELEKRYYRKDGEIVWGHLHVTIVKNPSDKPDYILTRIEDITERKKIQLALQISEEKYRTLYETMTQGVIHQDLNGRIISVNPAAEMIMGLNHYTKPGETCNYHCKALHEDGTDFPADTHPSMIALKTGKEVRNVVMGVFNPQKKSYRWINVNATPLFKPGEEKPFQVYITFEDITETIEAQKLLKETLIELRRSNSDLEQFAYVASHDLQEPLRMVASFTQLLEKQYKDKLDDTALEYINYAVDGAKRMQALIKDLLAYSRVTSHQEDFIEIDFEELIKEVLFNLEIVIDEKKAIITQDPLPIIRSDRLQMHQLFQNLIGNAIKYNNNIPCIHISAKEEDGNWVFGVSDNGIGINPEHYERVFQVFKRLHSNEEYDGTGIGLAICQKIVDRHGGRMWIESEVGKGSTFYFTIPVKTDIITLI
jgi:PAS domain S-box-containing protein